MRSTLSACVAFIFVLIEVVDVAFLVYRFNFLSSLSLLLTRSRSHGLRRYVVLLVNDWGISVSHQRCRCDEIVVVLAPPCQGFINVAHL